MRKASAATSESADFTQPEVTGGARGHKQGLHMKINMHVKPYLKHILRDVIILVEMGIRWCVLCNKNLLYSQGCILSHLPTQVHTMALGSYCTLSTTA